MPYKFGKNPATDDPRTLKFAKYRTTTLPTPTKIFGFGGLYNDWGMLGNDNYGDCVFAGADHETMLWNKRAGTPVPMSTTNALKDYSDVTGFDPNDPSTDNGTDMLDALRYRRATGIRDAESNRHKVAAYVGLEAGNFEQAIEACYIFGAIGIGFEVPETIWDQWDNGEYWDVVDPNASIIGGHYVPGVGSRNSAARITIVTWGRRWQMTKAFYEKYVDEAYAMLSEEQLRDGKGIHGLDLDQLRADLAAL